MPLVVGGLDLARGDQCWDLILGEVANFLTLAGEDDDYGDWNRQLRIRMRMINSKARVTG